eukprot:TRINITY_DN1735_c0_g1_i1.p1 TRINITY_DN1735_c0_g1~~TRINITY_DN1735_c0_g1_i1.p1  ORF type:complete len:1424 (-),score=318.81 TRINITY_DN1735_c0_g1_i1:611-4303(-)
MFPSSINLLHDCFFGQKTRPKLRVEGLIFMQLMFKHADEAKMNKELANSLLKNYLFQLLEHQELPTANQMYISPIRIESYRVISCVHVRFPSYLQDRYDVLLQLFKALEKEVNIPTLETLTETLSHLCSAFMQSSSSRLNEITKQLYDMAVNGHKYSQYVAMFYANRLFDLSEPRGRYLCLFGVCSTDTNVKLESLYRFKQFNDTISRNNKKNNMLFSYSNQINNFFLGTSFPKFNVFVNYIQDVMDSYPLPLDSTNFFVKYMFYLLKNEMNIQKSPKLISQEFQNQFEKAISSWGRIPSSSSSSSSTSSSPSELLHPVEKFVKVLTENIYLSKQVSNDVRLISVKYILKILSWLPPQSEFSTYFHRYLSNRFNAMKSLLTSSNINPELRSALSILMSVIVSNTFKEDQFNSLMEELFSNFAPTKSKEYYIGSLYLIGPVIALYQRNNNNNPHTKISESSSHYNTALALYLKHLKANDVNNNNFVSISALYGLSWLARYCPLPLSYTKSINDDMVTDTIDLNTFSYPDLIMDVVSQYLRFESYSSELNHAAVELITAINLSDSSPVVHSMSLDLLSKLYSNKDLEFEVKVGESLSVITTFSRTISTYNQYVDGVYLNQHVDLKDDSSSSSSSSSLLIEYLKSIVWNLFTNEREDIQLSNLSWLIQFIQDFHHLEVIKSNSDLFLMCYYYLMLNPKCPSIVRELSTLAIFQLVHVNHQNNNTDDKLVKINQLILSGSHVSISSVLQSLTTTEKSFITSSPLYTSDILQTIEPHSIVNENIKELWNLCNKDLYLFSYVIQFSFMSKDNKFWSFNRQLSFISDIRSTFSVIESKYRSFIPLMFISAHDVGPTAQYIMNIVNNLNDLFGFDTTLFDYILEYLTSQMKDDNIKKFIASNNALSELLKQKKMNQLEKHIKPLFKLIFDNLRLDNKLAESTISLLRSITSLIVICMHDPAQYNSESASNIIEFLCEFLTNEVSDIAASHVVKVEALDGLERLVRVGGKHLLKWIKKIIVSLLTSYSNMEITKQITLSPYFEKNMSADGQTALKKYSLISASMISLIKLIDNNQIILNVINACIVSDDLSTILGCLMFIDTTSELKQNLSKPILNQITNPIFELIKRNTNFDVHLLASRTIASLSRIGSTESMNIVYKSTLDVFKYYQDKDVSGIASGFEIIGQMLQISPDKLQNKEFLKDILPFFEANLNNNNLHPRIKKKLPEYLNELGNLGKKVL